MTVTGWVAAAAASRSLRVDPGTGTEEDGGVETGTLLARPPDKSSDKLGVPVTGVRGVAGVTAAVAGRPVNPSSAESPRG